MIETFTAGLRESLQAAFMLGLLLAYPDIWERKRILLWAGAIAFITGFWATYLPFVARHLPGTGNWTLMRHASEAALFYSGIGILALGGQYKHFPGFASAFGLWVLGFVLVFFEASSLGFIAHDAGVMAEAVPAAAAAGVMGVAAGILPLAVLAPRLCALRVERFFSIAGLLVTVGALKVLMGGVAGLESGNLLVALEHGVQGFTSSLIAHIQTVMLLRPHEFMSVEWAGLAAYLGSDRISTAIVVVFITAPPVFVLVDVFSSPDPVVSGLKVPAERRLKIAFFRKEMAFRAAPMLVSFVLLITALHAVNVSLNPMFEPEPIPVRESDTRAGYVVIPVADRAGDLTDGRLRKHLYYYGERKIIFIAIMKPDGTVGLALDECEICKPAEWNTAAVGYAQRGENLICKYCMTPIPVPSVNKPGGCNPIPLPFALEENNIVITVEDIVRVYKAARALDKKGMHL